MLLLFVSTQAAPATAGFINMSLVVGGLWPPLNANGPTDAIFWTEEELYAWIDEATKRLARRLGAFVVYDTSLSTIASTPDYNLPASHISTIQADLHGKVLRARNVQELEALDSNWPAATPAEPKSFVEDTHGLDRLTLYPEPDALNESLPIGLLIQKMPSEVTKANGILSVPDCLQDYFAFFALGEARSKESNASMDETAEWFKNLTQTYEQAITELWK